MPEDCPFCARIAGGHVTTQDGPVVAFADAFPVAEGHMLVAPRRHVARVVELTQDEWAALHRLGRRLLGTVGVDGATYGVNDGEAAGQTVAHVHLHVIPRRHGDVDDPRGGIRWVIADRAAYWSGS